MSAAPVHKPIVHFVGSIPLPDAETVFRTLAAATGPHLKRLPDGETGIRKTWIRFLQQVLADNPAIEVASNVPPFKFTQWDGKLLREIPRLRLTTSFPWLSTPAFDRRHLGVSLFFVELVQVLAHRGQQFPHPCQPLLSGHTRDSQCRCGALWPAALAVVFFARASSRAVNAAFY
ncbi:MAG TPA: hypothetical protein VNZ53_35730 [Steroidobacteraceae bacterium]|nr:hypothetical protein [Steroidobacteraceae bacterium]